jgi:hypothetical protein
LSTSFTQPQYTYIYAFCKVKYSRGFFNQTNIAEVIIHTWATVQLPSLRLPTAPLNHQVLFAADGMAVLVSGGHDAVDCYIVLSN